MFKDLSIKIFTKENFYNVLFIFIGSFICALAVSAIFLQHSLLSGGITGIAMFFNIKFHSNTSLLIILMNIPLLFLGYKFVSKKFMVFTIIGIAAFTASLNFVEQCHSLNQYLYPKDMLSAILLGGVLNGLGNGIILQGNGSGGGIDIIAKILNKLFSFSFASVGFAINIIIISIAARYFGLDIAIYTLATMYVSAKVTDFVLDGVNYKRSVFIISDKYDELSDAIMERTNRGVTKLLGEGAYTQQYKKVLFCTVSIHQLGQLKTIVKEIDPKAFMTITETSQVFGKGFINIKNH